MSEGNDLGKMVERASDELALRGILTSSSRELSNGIRVEFSDGEITCGISFYYSRKKGFSVIPAGGDRRLADRIRGILAEGSSSDDGSVADEVSSLTGSWIGTDEVSSLTGSWIGTDEVSSLTGSWIGTDEAGKGDYMGPLTVAAVNVDQPLAREFLRIGVRDSKTLADRTLRSLAEGIRRTAAGRFSVVSLTPLEYNKRLDQLNRKGRNSLDLLALCHAEAITELTGMTFMPDRVIIDRFCSENRIAHMLPRGDYILELRERGESDPAVAAASILAREAYMKGLEQLSEEYGIRAMPGSGRTTDSVARKFVDRYGSDILYKVAKVHFSNTSRILSLFG